MWGYNRMAVSRAGTMVYFKEIEPVKFTSFVDEEA
jgi:hypothetical protein